MYQSITLEVKYRIRYNVARIGDEVEIANFNQLFEFLYKFYKQVTIISYSIAIRGFKTINKKAFQLLLEDKRCISIKYLNYYNAQKDFELSKKRLRYYRNILIVSNN